MADNIVLNPGSGGKTVRTDQIAGVDIPESKIVIGADGVDDGYVSSANPLPVSAAALPLPAGASTAANQTTIIGHVDNVESLLTTIDTDTGVLAAKTGEYDTGIGTDTVAMLGVALPASGGAVAGGTATNPLRTDPTGTTTQPVSGTVTVTATALDIRALASGTDSVAAVQSGGWSVSLAAAIPTGDNTIGRVKLTDGTLVADIRDLTNTDALNVAVVDANGDQITSFGGSGSGTEYAEDTAAAAGEMVTMAGVVRQDSPASLVDVTGDRTELSVDANGRLYVNVHDGGNSLTVDGSVSITGALPAGTNNIGDVDIASLPDEGQQLMAASISVAIASDQSAVPVSGTVAATQSGSWTVDLGASLPAGTNNIGDVDVATMPATAANDALSLPSVLSVIAGWDGTNVKPIATNVDGEPIVSVSNISTITEYTEDAAADGDPAGQMPILVRSDALAARTTADGDNIAATATDYGEQRAYARTVERSGVLFDVVTEATVKRAAISASASGDNTIVAAVTGKKIRVVSLFLVASGAVTVRFESGAAGTALTGQMQLAANGGFTLGHNKDGWFETAAATLLNLELSAATSVDGALSYVEVD